MERLVQAEKECNDDIHKYSQDVNKQIHGILLNPRKEANRAMLDDISKIPREFINNGEKRWIELSKKDSLNHPLDFKYNILYTTPSEWQSLSENADDEQELGSIHRRLSAVIFAFASEQAKDKDT